MFRSTKNNDGRKDAQVTVLQWNLRSGSDNAGRKEKLKLIKDSRAAIISLNEQRVPLSLQGFKSFEA